MKIYIEDVKKGTLVPMDLFVFAGKMIPNNFVIVEDGSEKFSIHNNRVYLEDCDIEINYQAFADELEHCAQAILFDYE